MSDKVEVALLQVTIRRDANTSTAVTVPPYELVLLRQIFGKENVSVGEAVGQIEVDATAEVDRLSAKYGAEKVVQVYGDDGGERLTELVLRASRAEDGAAAEPSAPSARQRRSRAASAADD